MRLWDTPVWSLGDPLRQMGMTAYSFNSVALTKEKEKNDT